MFLVKHRTNSHYFKQCTALHDFKFHIIFVIFLRGGSLSCKISNLKCDSANAHDARAVKHENSISSHMNDFLGNFMIW